jgi:hypothetical protein
MIAVECDALREMLIAKNKEYGSSVFEPIGIFSAATPEDQIDVRIDDKLKRVQTIRQLAEVKIHEDTELDLIGYLVLKRVARKLKTEEGQRRKESEQG